MMRWEALSVPKDFGGLSFLETRAMNMALLAKWLFRTESGDSSMCINLLRTKYLGNCGVFQEKVKSCSFFWSGLRKVRDWYGYGKGMIVGDGKSTRFWLKNRFPSLYRICWENEATVEEIVTGRRSLSFRRNLGMLEREKLVVL